MRVGSGVKVREFAGHEEQVPCWQGDGDGAESIVREVSPVQPFRKIWHILERRTSREEILYKQVSCLTVCLLGVG